MNTFLLTTQKIINLTGWTRRNQLFVAQVAGMATIDRGPINIETSRLPVFTGESSRVASLERREV